VGLNILSTMDLVHIGCAGFNKALGPVRWQLRTVTLVWLALLWGWQLRSKQAATRRGMLALRTVLTLGLMFLPEMLLMAGGPGVAPSTSATKTYEVTLEGMGCEACQLHVQRLLQGSSGVVSAEVNFKTGKAQVEVAENWGFNMTPIAAALSDDGYEVLSTKQKGSTPSHHDKGFMTAATNTPVKAPAAKAQGDL